MCCVSGPLQCCMSPYYLFPHHGCHTINVRCILEAFAVTFFLSLLTTALTAATLNCFLLFYIIIYIFVCLHGICRHLYVTWRVSWRRSLQREARLVIRILIHHFQTRKQHKFSQRRGKASVTDTTHDIYTTNKQTISHVTVTCMGFSRSALHRQTTKQSWPSG